MFDIGFTELLVIGLVALIVIGPERLPKVARTVGSWMGKLNRYVSQVKQDIDRDIQLDELRKMQEDMKASAQKYELLAAEASKKVETEASRMDQMMQAMAATDGGLSLREYERHKAETGKDSNTPETDATPKDGTTEAPSLSDRYPADFTSSLDDDPTLHDVEIDPRLVEPAEPAMSEAGQKHQKTEPAQEIKA